MVAGSPGLREVLPTAARLHRGPIVVTPKAGLLSVREMPLRALFDQGLCDAIFLALLRGFARQQTPHVVQPSAVNNIASMGSGIEAIASRQTTRRRISQKPAARRRPGPPTRMIPPNPSRPRAYPPNTALRRYRFAKCFEIAFRECPPARISTQHSTKTLPLCEVL